VSGCIDNIYSVIIPLDGRVFGQDGNSPLTLLIVGVHDSFSPLAFSIQGTGLLKETINQGGFTVVNVGNNRDVTEILNHFSVLYCGGRGVKRADCTTDVWSVGSVILPPFCASNRRAHTENCTNIVRIILVRFDLVRKKQHMRPLNQ
jgi:hypothetical protein